VLIAPISISLRPRLWELVSYQATGQKPPRHAPWSDRIAMIVILGQDFRKIALWCSRLFPEDKSFSFRLKTSYKSLFVILKIFCKILVFLSCESNGVLFPEKNREVFSGVERDLN